jgi:hypothetical protein
MDSGKKLFTTAQVRRLDEEQREIAEASAKQLIATMKDLLKELRTA